MSNIFPLHPELEEDDDSLYYPFFLENQPFILEVNQKNNQFLFGRPVQVPENEELFISYLNDDESKIFFENIYPIFFVKIELKEKMEDFILLNFFNFEDGVFGLYYEQKEREISIHERGYFLVEVEETKLSFVKDELKKQRIVKWITDNFTYL